MYLVDVYGKGEVVPDAGNKGAWRAVLWGLGVEAWVCGEGGGRRQRVGGLGVGW